MKLDETSKEKVVKDVTDAITEGLLNNKKGILAREAISNSIHEKMDKNREIISAPKPPKEEPTDKTLVKTKTAKSENCEKTKKTEKATKKASKKTKASASAAEPEESKIESEVKDKILSKLKKIDADDKKLFTKSELVEKVDIAARQSAEVAIKNYKQNIKKSNIKLKKVSVEGLKSEVSEVEEVAKVAEK